MGVVVNTAIDPCLIRTYIFGYLFPKGADGKPDRTAISAVLPSMQTQVDVLDQAVARTGYLVGDSFSLADIYLMPVLEVAQRAPEGNNVQSAKHLARISPTTLSGQATGVISSPATVCSGKQPGKQPGKQLASPVRPLPSEPLRHPGRCVPQLTLFYAQ